MHYDVNANGLKEHGDDVRPLVRLSHNFYSELSAWKTFGQRVRPALIFIHLNTTKFYCVDNASNLNNDLTIQNGSIPRLALISSS